MKKRFLKKVVMITASAAMVLTTPTLLFAAETTAPAAAEFSLDSLDGILEEMLDSVTAEDIQSILDLVSDLSDEEIEDLLKSALEIVQEMPEEKQKEILESIQEALQEYLQEWKIPLEDLDLSFSELTEEDIDKLMDVIKIVRSISGSKVMDFVNNVKDEVENIPQEKKDEIKSSIEGALSSLSEFFS